MDIKNRKLKDYWKKFCLTKEIAEDELEDIFSFGDTKEMANDLSDLVKKGIKTATTSVYDPKEGLPETGKYCVVLDGEENPVCVIQNKVCEVLPFGQVSQEHAYHEGEGSRTYEEWRKVHIDFFTRECQAVKKNFGDETPVVCEVFEKVE